MTKTTNTTAVSSPEATTSAEADRSASSNAWKQFPGDFKPFHPTAFKAGLSYGQGWNDCYRTALAVATEGWPPEGQVGWLHRDGWNFISLHEKSRLQHHPEPGRKPPASEYNIPLIPGSAIPVNIEQMLERISFAVAYAHSMLLVDVSTVEGDANSLRIDKKRCSAAENQLSLASAQLKHLKVAIASQAPGDLPEGCSRLQVITRRPENFILTNIESGAHWRGSSHGVWRCEPE